MKKKTHYMLIGLLVATTFTACKKDDDDDNPPPAPSVTVNSDPQVSGKVDGTDFKYLTSGSGQTHLGYIGHSGGIAIAPDSSFFIMESGFEDIMTGDITFGIDMGTFGFVIPSDSNDLKNFFAIKQWAYSDMAENGVYIYYTDSNGFMWTTSDGTADQTGSTFSLEDRRYFEFSGENYVRIKASFNCKVYNGLGSVKLITNGVLVTDFWTEY